MPTTDQITLQYIAAEFIQKSHIAAVDVTYDLTELGFDHQGVFLNVTGSL